MSSTCDKCGNIAFHPNEVVKIDAVQSSVKTTDPQSLKYFELRRDPTVDPAVVDELLIMNQQEWQMWARVTEDFKDLNRHTAYLYFSTDQLEFPKATERYQTHRRKFLGRKGEEWQVEQADTMLERLKGLCAVQMEREQIAPKSEFLIWAVDTNATTYRVVLKVAFLLIGAGVLSLAFTSLFI